MNREDLQKFCSTDSTRHHIQAPWSREEWTLATNGHIGIRIPRLEQIPENPNAPDLLKLFSDSYALEGRLAFTVPEPVSDIKVCHVCNGALFIYQHRDELKPCGKNYPGAEACDYCDQGTIEKGKTLVKGPLGEVILNSSYVRLIRSLPNPQLLLFGDESDRRDKPIQFKFDGGDGLLMPMRG